MTTRNFTTTIETDQTPEAVFNAIINVRGWWSEEIEGPTDKMNDVFKYHFEDIHRCRIKLVEVVPGQRVVWLVMDNYFKPGIFGDAAHQPAPGATAAEAEWVNTIIHFEISHRNGRTQMRFTHQGLVPEYACFDICENGWNHYIRQSLLSLINTGKGQPNSAGTPEAFLDKRTFSGRGQSQGQIIEFMKMHQHTGGAGGDAYKGALEELNDKE